MECASDAVTERWGLPSVLGVFTSLLVPCAQDLPHEHPRSHAISPVRFQSGMLQMLMVLMHMQKGEAFLASPSVQAALRKEQGSRCSEQFSYLLEGTVPADLETVFCRGIEWDCGVEHVLLLQASVCHCLPGTALPCISS